MRSIKMKKNGALGNAGAGNSGVVQKTKSQKRALTHIGGKENAKFGSGCTGGRVATSVDPKKAKTKMADRKTLVVQSRYQKKTRTVTKV